MGGCCSGAAALALYTCASAERFTGMCLALLSRVAAAACVVHASLLPQQPCSHLLLQDIADLMMECMRLEPSERPTVRLIRAALRLGPCLHWASQSSCTSRYLQDVPLCLLPMAPLSLLHACLPPCHKQASQIVRRLEGRRCGLEESTVDVPVRSTTSPPSSAAGTPADQSRGSAADRSQ